MNVTPRYRSTQNPTFRSPPKATKAREDVWKSGSPLPSDSKKESATILSHKPAIPLSILDAPTQRLYLAAIYLALIAWRLFDFSYLVAEETDSLWLFMKWVALDGVFLFGIPGLGVPWLEWSSLRVAILFLLHALVNGILMFRIRLPFEAALAAIFKMFYDKELAISERRVRPASILQTSSLFQGKQIVKILPEGSSILNPGGLPFCIGSQHPIVELPIVVNQSLPVHIELLRIDLGTGNNETISIPRKECAKLLKKADKEIAGQGIVYPRILRYPVKKTGLYRLQKVVDKSQLEVQRPASDTVVVECPKGWVRPSARDRCLGELSNFSFQVDAAPPIKIKYSKTFNEEDRYQVELTMHTESLEGDAEDDWDQSISSTEGIGTLGSSWTRMKRFEVPINETLTKVGPWYYMIDQVEDGYGNTVSYTDLESPRLYKAPKDKQLIQIFEVHGRPRAALGGCSPQSSLKVAQGRSRSLPILFNPTSQYYTGADKHYIDYAYTPIVNDQGTESNPDTIIYERLAILQNEHGPEIKQPGLYRLTAVSTDFCSGEVLEPSSCLLLNPPEPSLSLASEKIPHKCAENSVGLRVTLDLIGTPPFEVSYRVHRKGDSTVIEARKFDSLRTQIELKPAQAGHYTYEFFGLRDAVYERSPALIQKALILEQDVKPTAWAIFTSEPEISDVCIGDSAALVVLLSGEPPWILNYNIILDGKRNTYTESNLRSKEHQILTPKLTKGGIYTVTLTSVTDSSGCRISLQQETKIHVRHQMPTAAFGYIEGNRRVNTLEGKNVGLPIRLSGERPWILTVEKDGRSADAISITMESPNDILEVDSEGFYELKQVHDRFCPGSIDREAHIFEVGWAPRPLVKIAESPRAGSVDRKSESCEGDYDSMTIEFMGNPPFELHYAIDSRLDTGQHLVSNRQENFGSHVASLRLETVQAGMYTYKIVGLGDQSYEANMKKFTSIQTQHTVHKRPTATFKDFKRTYSYCKEHGENDERINISLTGKPPFALEIDIKHHATNRLETMKIPSIMGHRYDLHIPRNILSLGTHSVTIRKVSDASGCQEDSSAEAPSTRVHIVDVPSITSTEQLDDFCVGDHISFRLAGTPPFSVFYTFEGIERKASSSTTLFRRLAEKPGNFTILGVSDKAGTSKCRARTEISKTIHDLPSVRISNGKVSEVDIHEGGEAEIVFEFIGTPPFEFTYTRSAVVVRGKRSMVLETKTDVSHEHKRSIQVSEEGIYEVVAVRDKFCGATTQPMLANSKPDLLEQR